VSSRLEAGDGELVVLLHGWPQGKEAWRDVVPRLADAGLRAVAPDQRGYRPGDRVEPRSAYRLANLARDVLDLADRPRFHVVGHDWGGAVAWQLAAEHPDRIATATIVATPHPRAMVRSMAGTQALRSLYMLGFNIPRASEGVLRARNGAVLRRALRSSGLDAATADAYTDRMLDGDALTRGLAWYRANTPNGARAVGPSVVPTLYVWPSGDVALGRAAAERTADHVDAPYRFVELAGAPHWVPELRPAELAALIVEQVQSRSA
jgi:pimeloyl-ACP methyl ester carboxylesterase